ncbi:hypothetical protein BLJAPNOD_06934 [Ensifer sp. M14]|nr:hypothetical protein BLJAPNOD_06934 [Ensifer sp. M14]
MCHCCPALERFCEQLEMVGEQNVIVGSEPNQPSASLAETNVSVRITKMRRFRKIEEADPIILEPSNHISSARNAAIADNQEFEITEGLRKHRLDSDPNHVHTVVGRHEYRNTRCAHHPFAEPKL